MKQSKHVICTGILDIRDFSYEILGNLVPQEESHISHSQAIGK